MNFCGHCKATAGGLFGSNKCEIQVKGPTGETTLSKLMVWYGSLIAQILEGWTIANLIRVPKGFLSFHSCNKRRVGTLQAVIRTTLLRWTILLHSKVMFLFTCTMEIWPRQCKGTGSSKDFERL